MKTTYRIFFLFLLNTCYCYSQIRIAQSVNNTVAINSSAFIDASSQTNYNITSNIGKGLLFPVTRLNQFTAFGGENLGGEDNYPNFYDGLTVYNVTEGGAAGVGKTEGTLCRGVWYYDNPGMTNVTEGTWRPILPCP